MATFPNLKTGVVAQYPLARAIRFATQAVRFLDGSQQTFRLNARGLRRWTVALNGLDESELDSIISFVEAVGGSQFEYTDPLTGETVGTCRLAADSSAVAITGVSAARAEVVIEEIG